MCEIYGVCPAPAKQVDADKQLHILSAEDVAEFIVSLGPNGTRQTCPDGCTIYEHFNASRFVERGINGAALARLTHAHENRAWVHNTSLREKHAEFLAGHGVFGAAGLKGEQRIALMTRLRDALRHAGFAVAPIEPKRRLVELARAARAEERKSERKARSRVQ